MSDKTTVAPMDPALQNSPLSESVDGATTVNLEREDNQCLWNGQAFAEGAIVECGGDTFECSYGRWIEN